MLNVSDGKNKDLLNWLWNKAHLAIIENPADLLEIADSCDQNADSWQGDENENDALRFLKVFALVAFAAYAGRHHTGVKITKAETPGKEELLLNFNDEKTQGKRYAFHIKVRALFEKMEDGTLFYQAFKESRIGPIRRNLEKLHTRSEKSSNTQQTET